MQPLLSSARRAVERLRELGEPVDDESVELLSGLSEPEQTSVALDRVGALLDPLTLMHVTVGPYGFERAEQVGGAPSVPQGGWRSFLVRFDNPHGLGGPFTFHAGSGDPVGRTAGRIEASFRGVPDRVEHAAAVRANSSELRLVDPAELSGAETEYAVVSVYSRDAGPLTVDVGFALPGKWPARAPRWMGQEHLEARTVWSKSGAKVSLEFDARPSRVIALDIRDADGRSCVASVAIRDSSGRVYPAQAMRLAPDMFFQPHVYRGTGETVELPAGAYQVTAWRGIEYRPTVVDLIVEDGVDEVVLQLDRWIDPATRGYYGGDPHLHAGGCAHYSFPTEGVAPETMIRHARGEGLWIADVLSWGQCHYYQKQFFTGESISPPADLEHPELQEANGVRWQPRPTETDGETSLNYDLEISGFPSSHSGHILLLGLSDQDYPGTAIPDDWPSWNLPIHRWAQAQGAFTGHPHSGFGMLGDSRDLPNFDIPPFYSVGSNEFFVDIANGAADFIGVAALPVASELNVWYHLLNAGFAPHILGETDYPCLSDDRPGVGRTYVKLDAPPTGPTALRSWIDGIRRGSSYVGDGRSHIFDLAVDGDEDRFQRREGPAPVRVTASVAALLPPERPTPVVPGFSFDDPHEEWHLEYARIAGTRSAPVELVVNGVAVATTELPADGVPHDIAFDVLLDRSCWVALRILPSVHTQPIFIEIADRPIRASRRSAQWLLDCVDKLWEVKHGFIRPAERVAARAAYDNAKAVFAARRDECEID
jgi:hypothetical protein